MWFSGQKVNAGYGRVYFVETEKLTVGQVASFIGAALGGLLLVVVLIFAIGAANQSYSRYQRVQNAHNQQRVIEMQVVQTQKLVEVETQKAAVRVAEAKGIADSQAIIDSSLTDQYLTYLSIQAQIDFAKSNSATIIYIPVGDNGIPLIRDTSSDADTTQPKK